MLSLGRREKVAQGSFLFTEGQRSDHVFIVMSGRLKLLKTSLDGKEILVEIRGPGQILGELGAVDGHLRSASARAISSVEVLAITVDSFSALLDSHPGLARAVLGSVVERLRESADRRLESGAGGVKSQLCGRLLELSANEEPEPGGQVEIRSPLTQQELADWIGVSRDAVVMALQQLRADGIVETGRRRIRICDPAALHRIAQSA